MRNCFFKTLFLLFFSSSPLFAEKGEAAEKGLKTAKSNHWQGYVFASGVLLAVAVGVIAGTLGDSGDSIHGHNH